MPETASVPSIFEGIASAIVFASNAMDWTLCTAISRLGNRASSAGFHHIASVPSEVSATAASPCPIARAPGGMLRKSAPSFCAAAWSGANTESNATAIVKPR